MKAKFNPPPAAHLDGSSAVKSSLRLLVVEDNADLSFALKSFFRLTGHRAWFAVNVASALRLAAEQSFDVLLSDIGLPDGNGWDLRAQLVKADLCPPHAVAMSGFGLAEHAARSQEEGFACHLVKPFDPVKLLEVLHAATSPVTDQRPATTHRASPGLCAVRTNVRQGSFVA